MKAGFITSLFMTQGLKALLKIPTSGSNSVSEPPFCCTCIRAGRESEAEATPEADVCVRGCMCRQHVRGVNELRRSSAAPAAIKEPIKPVP